MLHGVRKDLRDVAAAWKAIILADVFLELVAIEAGSREERHVSVTLSTTAASCSSPRIVYKHSTKPSRIHFALYFHELSQESKTQVLGKLPSRRFSNASIRSVCWEIGGRLKMQQGQRSGEWRAGDI